jgi:sugar (pentulose or hexulose) kinase
LLVSAGLCGGRSYALLERFFRDTAEALFDLLQPRSVYEAMNRLAASVPSGADGLRCVPFFTGTRAHPELRGALTGMSPENFTPAHLARALLEGMAMAFRSSFDLIRQVGWIPCVNPPELICSGNGMRENPLLMQLVSEAFRLRGRVAAHREEAAHGAARLAAVGLGLTAF